jgi:PadR family transcriptional regulator AphA
MSVEKTSAVESLLGVLSVEPMSGYEMRQFMERSTANFWSESFGQIYPALRRMLAEGLVEVEKHDADGHPAKKVYRITEAGTERLRDWLGLPLKPHRVRNELLLKLFFGERGSPSLLAEQVCVWRRRYEDDLQRYEAIVQKMETLYAKEPGMPFWRMTVRYGMAEARMVIAWCEETEAQLKSSETTV